MTGPYRGLHLPGAIVDECIEHDPFRSLADLDAALLRPVHGELIAMAQRMLADLDERQQQPLPAWIQPPAPVGRAEQLHALDVLTTELRDGTDELDRRMRELTKVAFRRTYSEMRG